MGSDSAGGYCSARMSRVVTEPRAAVERHEGARALPGRVTPPAWPFAGLLAIGVIGLAAVGLLPVLVALAVLGLLAVPVAFKAPELLVVGGLAASATSGMLLAHAQFEVDNLWTPLGLLLLGAIALRFLLTQRRYVIQPSMGLLLLGAFIAVTAVQIPFTEGLALGVRAFRDTGWFMAIALAIAVALQDPQGRRRLTTGIVLVSLFVGAYACLRWAIGPDPTEFALARTNRFLRVDDHYAQFGSFPGRGGLAAWCAFTIPFCLAVGLLSHGIARATALVTTVLLGVALVGTEVRTGSIAAALACALVVVAHPFARAQRGLRLGAAAVTAVLLLVGGVVLSEGGGGTTADRFARVFSAEEEQSFQARQSTWAEATDIASRQPFGLGLGTLGRASSFASTDVLGSEGVESSYLLVALEQGLPSAFLLGCLLLALVIGLVRRSLATADPARAGPALGAAGTVLSLSVMMSTGIWLGGPFGFVQWCVVGLGLASVVVAAQEREPALTPLRRSRPEADSARG